MFTCEFAGRVAVVDVASRTLLRMIDMPVRNTHMGPQDIKLAPDGSGFYIADSDQGGLWVLDGAATKVIGQIPTGAGAHGIYLSRDASKLYVTNRIEGSVSVLDAYTGAAIDQVADPRRRQPRHGRGDRRRHPAVAVRPLQPRGLRALHRRRAPARRSRSGDGPHGLCVWPQPGRYSLGHTGITR